LPKIFDRENQDGERVWAVKKKKTFNRKKITNHFRASAPEAAETEKETSPEK